MGRSGFTVLATVVVLVVAGILGAAVVLPLVENAVHQRNVERTVDYLFKLTDGNQRGMQKFVGNHNRPPAQMTQLSEPFGGGTPSACGQNLQRAGDWEGLADRLFVPSGVPTPIGVIANDLIEDGGDVMVEIVDVLLSDAERMDRMVDDPPGAATGRVRWVVTDAEQELVSLRWVTPFQC